MQIVAVELMAKLRDTIDAIEEHLSCMDCVNLQALEARLPKSVSTGSAEMVMLLLIYREMDARKP